MPVADFPGRFGWGYDGVNLFAPTRLYGAPDDFRRFVDRAHGRWVGSDPGCRLQPFWSGWKLFGILASIILQSRYKNEWGEAINFDSENCGRCGNSLWRTRHIGSRVSPGWVAVRCDATDLRRIKEHILAEIARAARDCSAGRWIYIVAENECRRPLVRTAERAVTAWTRSGMTIFTIARSSH